MAYGYGLGVYFADYNDRDEVDYDHQCAKCEADLKTEPDDFIQVDEHEFEPIFTCPNCGADN